VSQTYQTLLLAASTLAAVIITFMGSYYLLRWQTRNEARAQRNRVIGELLAAATDLINGLRVFRAAHSRRTTWRYYLHLAVTFLPYLTKLTGWRDLGNWVNMKPIYDSALQFDRYQTDQQHTIVLDLSNILQTRLNRYLAVASMLALGDDEVLAEAVRDLTPEITNLTELTTAHMRRVESAIDKAQRALDEFAAVIDKHRK
jgi:hypothetical protein